MCLQALAYFLSLLLLYDLCPFILLSFFFVFVGGADFPFEVTKLPFSLLPSDFGLYCRPQHFLCFMLPSIILDLNLSCNSMAQSTLQFQSH